MRLLVTGGAGFIGSEVVRQYLAETEHAVVNIDNLTYSANPRALAGIEGHARYLFEKADICDKAALTRIFRDHRPNAVMHLAAETHVDRSIDGPGVFVMTNVVGTQVLLDVAADYWRNLDAEDSPYAPRSPYAASKAAADHLVRAWYPTYGFPVVISNTCNNFGPFQHVEKMIPLMILKARAGESMPVYGDGSNVRDWLYVADHARGLRCVLDKGRIGDSYNIGGGDEWRNIDLVETICDIMDELRPRSDGSHRALIGLVSDRPGHDFR